MYPNLHSDLDYKIPSGEVLDTKPPIQKISQKENGYKQFFPKTTKLTKEFLDKVPVSKFSKLAKTETYVFGDEWRISRLIVIAVLLILFLFSFFGIVFMWYTDGFNSLIYSNLVIREGSPAFEMWKNPSPKLQVRVYIFNYTNVDKYEDGTDKKLNVEEKGPYVYEETLERVNIKFNGSYVSYQYKRSYKFIPELSKGRQNDIVVVPNILMLAVAAINRYSNFFTRLTIAGGLNGLTAKPFVTMAADRFIVGYEDQLYSLSKSVMKFQDKKPAEKMGLLSQKVGVNPDVYTIHTGLNNIDQIGTLTSINGEGELSYWSTKECNSISGTDGTMFSPKAVSKKQPVTVFLKELCRAVPLVYQRDNEVFDGDIPSYHYSVPETLFDSAENHVQNQCFCEMDGGTCPMQGLFNTTVCAMGAPMFVSFPHFHRGDPRLFEGVTGLNPNHTLHETFLDLHPHLGFPMNGASRIQLNIQVLKTFGFSQLDRYENELILPMAWFELNLEDKSLPDDVKDLIATGTHTVALIEFLLKYGSIIIAVLTLVPIVANIKHRLVRNRRTNSVRPLQKQETDC